MSSLVVGRGVSSKLIHEIDFANHAYAPISLMLCTERIKTRQERVTLWLANKNHDSAKAYRMPLTTSHRLRDIPFLLENKEELI